MRFLILLFASGFGAGYVPLMPGTIGSIAGVLAFLVIYRMSGHVYLITLFAFIFLSIWISGRAESIYGKRDDKRIVIDEVAGMLVSLFAIPFSLKFLFLGFLLFRFFDITKIFPANIAQRKLNGGLAVVLDDIIAGIYTNICLKLLIKYL
jgi:phosphatidylglycerophosphatase A